MKSIVFLLIAICPGMVKAQTYTNSTQGSNNSAGGAYVAPVVTKVYNASSPGYQAPSNTSYKNTNGYTSATSAVAATANATNTSKASEKRFTPGIYLAENGKWGVTDFQGYKASPAIYDNIFEWTRISMGIAVCMVRIKDKWGLIWAPDGVPIVPIEYDELVYNNIGDTKLLARKGTKWGILYCGGAETYKVLIPVENDEIGTIYSFNAYNWVRVGDKFGLYNLFYKAILSTEYQDIRFFNDGAILVKKDGKMGLMNISGGPILPIEYESISAVNQKTAWILKGGKWGLINEAGKVLTPAQYDSVYLQPNGMIWMNDKAVVSKAGKLIYLDDEGMEIDPSIKDNSPQLTLFTEDFNDAAKNNWPTVPNASIKNGVYEVTAAYSPVDKDIEIPFPAGIKYNPEDDWMLEVSISDVDHKSKKRFGIMMKNKINGTSKSYYTVNPAYAQISCVKEGQMVKLGKIKKDFNKLKLVKRGNNMEIYYNKDLLYTGAIGQEMKGKFYLFASRAWENAPDNVVAFDDIHFEILNKK